MRRDYTAGQFVQLLTARIGACSSIELGDRIVPVKHDPSKKVWIVLRGEARAGVRSLFEDDEKANVPFRLVKGGEISLYIRIREQPNKRIEILSYRIDSRLPDNVTGVTSLRFENDDSGRRGSGWDEDLQDNPEHPLNHLHLNYLQGADANMCRMPTGEICPIVLLRAVDYWYLSILG
jgi:hypothetical protein